MLRKLLVIISVLFVFPSVALAGVGVGVATGKIVVSEKLHSGVVYKLPPVSVINTGDVTSNYSVDIAYLETQTELKPEKSWFSFDPINFALEPGKSQDVNITLTLPLKVVPGKYFAYLEGFPVKNNESGQTSVGIAAASKLYFEVAPSNVFQGIYYRFISLWNNNQPYSNVLGGVVVAIVVVSLFRKFFKFELKLKNSEKDDSPKETDSQN